MLPARLASRRRAEAVRGYLRQRGASESVIARIHAPAGLDLERVAHQEIAVAILAELVRLRAAGALAHAGGGARDRRSRRVGHRPDLRRGRHRRLGPLPRRARRRGRYFCYAGCQLAFEERPAEALAISPRPHEQERP